MSLPKIILVLPCFNEEASLPHTIKKLEDTVNKLNAKYLIDILFVNDGSSDRTQDILESSSMIHSNLLYIKFSKNAGHQSALRAGLNVAVDYDAAIMLDADLQHPPELIPDMLEKWKEGYKIVQMIREEESDGVKKSRDLVGRMYYKMVNSISEITIEQGASDFRLIDNSVINTLNKSIEQDLFLRGYFSWLPVTRTTINYKPNKRIAGNSKYTFKKLMKLSYTSILQFSEKPLRISVTIGLLTATFALVYGIIVSIAQLLGLLNVSGWASLMVVILFCFGINFVILGVLGHYLAHLISLIKQRPEFIIEKINLNKHKVYQGPKNER